MPGPVTTQPATGDRADDVDLVVLEVSPERDPGGERLRATLDAHFELERKQWLRMVLLYGSILFSVPLWLSVAWPGLVPLGLRNLALLSWAGCAAACVVTLVSEHRWRRELLRCEAGLPAAGRVSS
jgi:hypothetical protein